MPDKAFNCLSLKSFLLVLLSSSLNQVPGAHGEVVVNLPSGKIEGEKMFNTLNFKSIPYAKPPVGNLRFAPPQEMDPWDDIKDTRFQPRRCPQQPFSDFMYFNWGIRSEISEYSMDEDCLYLGVYRPINLENNQTGLPVMIWINDFIFTDELNPSILVDEGKVVVVSVQYRQGVFGNLRLKASNGDEIALGNQGLQDVMMAIKWVHNNIHLFNGDAEKITLLGRSLGSVSASALWLSPQTDPYLKRVVLHSGTVLSRWGFSDLDEAHKNAENFASDSGCDAKSDRASLINCLQGQSMEQILNTSLVTWKWAARERCSNLSQIQFERAPEDHNLFKDDLCALYYDNPFKHIVDGDIIPKAPKELLKESSQKNKKQLMLGVNENDGIFFLLAGLQDIFGDFMLPNGTLVIPDAFFEAAKFQTNAKIGKPIDMQMLTVARFLDSKYFHPNIATLPALLYGIPEPGSRVYAYELLESLEKFVTDMDFVCPTLEFAELAARDPNVDVYFYRFDSQAESKPVPKWIGSNQGAELAYVLGQALPGNRISSDYTLFPHEVRLSDEMRRNWINFARRGFVQ